MRTILSTTAANHSEVNYHKNEYMRKTERIETSLLLLFIYEVKLHFLQVMPRGLVLKLTTKGRRLIKPAEEQSGREQQWQKNKRWKRRIEEEMKKRRDEEQILKKK